MNEYGQINISIDLPDPLKDKVKCVKTYPCLGIDLALVTSTHFIEMKDSIIQRSLLLPDPKEEINKIDVVYSDLGWCYVLFGEESVSLISGDKFQVVQSFQDVDTAGIKDFLGVCKPLLFIEYSNGESILTDGHKNYDLKQVWPPDESKSNVQETLSKRLRLASDHAENKEQKLRALKEMVQESGRSLADTYYCNPTIKEDDLINICKPGLRDTYPFKDDPKQNIIQVLEKHIKTLHNVFVCILEFKSTIPLNELCLQSVCETSIPTTTKSSIVTFREEGGIVNPEGISDLDPDRIAFAVLLIPTSLVTLNKSDNLQFNLSISSAQGSSKVEVIKLSSHSLFSPSQSSLSSNKAFVIDLLGVYVRGVKEKIRISTKLGVLANLEQVLLGAGFTKSPNRFGYHCWNREAIFYGTAMIYERSSPHQLIATIYALTYSKLALFIKLLQSQLTCDTKISLYSS